MFGVNRHALLHTLDYFDVTSGALVPDIMHNVLEGVLPLEIKSMLKVVEEYVCIMHCVLKLYILGVHIGAKSIHTSRS